MIGYARGGMITGKELVSGNSPKNDTVTVKASPGEIFVDKETISKGPKAIIDFVLKEVRNHYPEFKTHFDEGGTTVNRPVAQVNDAQKKAFSTVNQPAQIETDIANGVKSIKSALGFNKGGTVPWDAAPPSQDEIESAPPMAWDEAPPRKDELKDISKTKTSFGEKAQTALENLGNMTTLGYLPQLQAASGPYVDKAMDYVLGEKSEPKSYVQRRDEANARIKKESAENPNSALAGKAAGFIISAGATPELPFLKGAGILKGAQRGAIYGAGFGAASNPGDVEGTVDPAQLGNRAENAIRGAGFGAALGAGFGIIGRKAALAKEAELADKQSVEANQSQSTNASASGEANAKANIQGGEQSVEMGGAPFAYRAPKNLEELNNWNPPAGTGELRGASRLREIEQILPDLKTPPLSYHYDMMQNPKSMKELKLQFENLPTDSAKKIAQYNQGIVDESAAKTLETVHNMTGSVPKTATEAGHAIINHAKELYTTEQQALKPVFEKFQDSPPLSPAEGQDLIQNLAENSKFGKFLAKNENGEFYLKPNKTTSGLSNEEHQALGEVVRDLNNGATFKEIQNAREYLRKMMDPANPKATEELGKVRSLMLGQLGEMAKKQGEDVGSAFQKYAINEKNREAFEEIIGGSIKDMGKMFNANPNAVVGKIFANPNHTEIVRDYLGKGIVDEMAQSYIMSGIEKSFDSVKGFQPHVMRSFLNSKATKQILDANVDPAVVERLNALADYGAYGKKFLEDVNPSGTAASLVSALEPKNFFAKVKQKGIVGALEATVGEKVQAVTQQKQAIKAVNEALGTKTPDSLMSQAGNAINQNIPRKMLEAVPARAAVGEPENQTLYGPKKWQNDGLNNLMNHADNEMDQQMLTQMKDKLQSTKKGQQLLIEASTLKPGSKRLDRVLSDIKGMQK